MRGCHSAEARALMATVGGIRLGWWEKKGAEICDWTQIGLEQFILPGSTHSFYGRHPGLEAT